MTPFQQAKRYAAELPYSARPRWIVVCNFAEFHVHDLERPHAEPEIVRLENLEKEYYRLNFLVDEGDENTRREFEISIKAGELVGLLYDEFLAQYRDPSDPRALRSLNVLCVRLVFCLYAEDAGIFGRHAAFHDYLRAYDAPHARRALIELFRVLDTRPEDRDPYLAPELAAFPYVNGGLFADENVEIPNFTDRIRSLLLREASENFDWSEISPTIFGAVFESTLNPETRRSGGMHYTSLENIHKVIDPLFLDELRAEFEAARAEPVERSRERRFEALRARLASLTFLDPACGSGNFLTETYLSLRRLENDVLRERSRQIEFDLTGDLIRVSIGQFYGIEINDFAVTVAKTALWIAESQMLKETEDIVRRPLDFLPLKSYANIVEGNALRIDWASVVPREKLSFIMGNPPFVGARLMSPGQKEELFEIFGKKWKNVGNLDYVSAWYLKTAELIAGTPVRAALVSTNSVTQGEQVAALWKPLFERFGVRFDFAYRTFRWDSEASVKAHVHCVIIGFSFRGSDIPVASAKSLSEQTPPRIFLETGNAVPAKNINAYLIDAPDVFVESRNRPLCDVPEMGIGNKPIDGGNYLFTPEEKTEFLKREPAAEKFFRPWLGAEEFINGKKRFCLWLGDCPPNVLRSMPECMKRVQAVREFRLASKSAGTRKIAETPTRFHVENMPCGNYLLVPSVSSERRKYVPMGFLDAGTIASNLVLIVPEATLYHFGVLTSNVHMAWMRAVCGRLEMRYRYSASVVYNNFPWPVPAPELRAKIEATARAILDARERFPECSLADLYDETTMPAELRRAHRDNDRVVMEAYGFDWRAMTESACVAVLMSLHRAQAGTRGKD